MTHNAQSDSDFLRELATRKHFEYVASLESERDSLRAALILLLDDIGWRGRYYIATDLEYQIIRLLPDMDTRVSYPPFSQERIEQARKLLEEANSNGE